MESLYLNNLNNRISQKNTLSDSLKKTTSLDENIKFVQLLLDELQEVSSQEESNPFLGTTSTDADPFAQMMSLNQSYMLGKVLRALSQSNISQLGLDNQQQQVPGIQAQTTGSTVQNRDDLGLVSAKYESSGNPGVISNTPGDPGGKSYGAWQFNTRDGIVINFYKWSKDHDPEIYAKLNEGYKADGSTNGSNFDAAWKQVAKDDSKGFWQLQHDFTKERYYDAAAKRLLDETGFDINKQSYALQNVLWSTSVQHGVGGAIGIFKDINLGGSQSEIITDIYKERQKVDVYFRSCSQEVKNSVFNRFGREMKDAIQLL